MRSSSNAANGVRTHTVRLEGKEVVLINFGRYISNSTIPLDWGKENGLIPAPDDTPSAIQKAFPDLHHEIGVEEMGVVSLIKHHSEIPSAWWYKKASGVGFVLREEWMHGWRSGYWFVFSRE